MNPMKILIAMVLLLTALSVAGCESAGGTSDKDRDRAGFPNYGWDPKHGGGM